MNDDVEPEEVDGVVEKVGVWVWICICVAADVAAVMVMWGQADRLVGD